MSFFFGSFLIKEEVESKQNDYSQIPSANQKQKIPSPKTQIYNYSIPYTITKQKQDLLHLGQYLLIRSYLLFNP